MNHTEDLSDELLARYLSGQATPDEEAQVEDYAAAGDERAADLLAMAEGIRLQRKAEAERRRLWQQPWLRWSAAAALVLLLGLTWFFSARGTQMQTEAAPVLAAQDTLDASDTLTDEPLPCYE